VWARRLFVCSSSGIHFDTTPTIGANSVQCQVTLADQKTVRLSVWDTAGQDDFKSLFPMFVRVAEVAIVVFDVARRNRIQ
jgi:Ras-related protein Rab-6A